MVIERDAVALRFYAPNAVDARYEVMYRQFKGLDVGPIEWRDFDAWFCKRRFDRIPYCFDDEPYLDLKVKPLTSAERMRRLRARSKLVNEAVGDVYIPKPLRSLVSDLVRTFNDTGVIPSVTCDDSNKLDKIRSILDSFYLHPTSPRAHEARKLIAALRGVL